MASTAKFDSMVFYRGWITTARQLLPAKEVPTLMIQLIDYGLDGIMPQKFTSEVAKAIFMMAVPSIDVNIKKKMGGQKGVRRKAIKAAKKSDGKTIGKTIGNNNVDVDADVDADAYTSTNVDVTSLRSAPASEAGPPSGESANGGDNDVEEEWEWHDPEEYISSKRTTSSDSPESKG
jgi:hypothetical protein